MGFTVKCDCGNDTFHIEVDLQRDNAVGIFGTAICTECGFEQEMGGDA